MPNKTNKTNASFEEWLTDGWQCSNLKNQETHAEAPEPNLPITGNFIDVTLALIRSQRINRPIRIK